MDIALTTWINGLSIRFAALDDVMVFWANWGLHIIVAATVALWWMRKDRVSVRHACIVAALAFLASLAINQIILLFIHRPRPYVSGLTHLLILPNPDWSFPSDHATAVAAICAALALRRIGWPLVFFLPVALLVCITRVFVGVHFASDVVGGIVIGACTAYCVHKFYRPELWPFRRLVAFL